MKTRLYPLALPVMLALAACRPGAAEYSEAEGPKVVKVDSAESQLEFTFARGSYRLAPGEGGRLHRLMLAGRIRPDDRVTIAAAGDPHLQGQRIETITRELLRFGVVAEATPLVGIEADRAILVVGRYTVSLPACPDWSQDPSADFTNAFSSNFGCANVTNLGMMVASPADLVSGRELAPADGETAVAAVDRYLTDKVKLPAVIGGAAPLSAAAGGAPAGGGAPTGGQ
jgi:pilus assembly protein CpaD